MTYAIEIKHGDNQEYILIDGEKVVHRMGMNPFLTLTRMNLDGFHIQPGKTFFVPALNEKTAQERKAVFRDLIQQGITLVVTTFRLSRTNYLKKNLMKARHAMINSPIDYVIGISVKVKDLTPALMLEITKHKLPFIILEFENWDEVYSITWEWIRESCIGHRPLFVPQCENTNDRPREIKKRYMEWAHFSKSINIPTTTPFTSKEPFNISQLKALGIYPIKGTFRPGADCDYVLYSTLLEGGKVNRYDKVTPCIVVIRGKIQLAGQEIFRPGYGRELKIRLPYRFTDFWECSDKKWMN